MHFLPATFAGMATPKEEQAQLRKELETLDPQTLRWVGAQKKKAASFWRMKMLANPKNPGHKQRMLETENEAAWFNTMAMHAQRLQDRMVTAMENAADSVKAEDLVLPDEPSKLVAL